jgi:tRNA G10  N-methylase Trm11
MSNIQLHNCHYEELFNILPDKSIDIAICDIPYGVNYPLPKGEWAS